MGRPYANISDVEINVGPGSYIKGNSVENGTSYRTYVGGVVGFWGETLTMSNDVSNIDVIGNVLDVGGITGIAHYRKYFYQL